MAITLPASPTNNATFTHNGFRYIYRSNRWDSEGFTGQRRNLANLASYSNMPSTLPAFNGNTSFHARNPWNGTGAGTADSNTDGFLEQRSGTAGLSLSNNMGILFPENMYHYIATGDTGSSALDFGSNLNCNALIGTTYYRCAWSSDAPGSFNKTFGTNGNQGLVNQMSLPSAVQSNHITAWTDVLGWEFKVPTSNVANVTAGTTVRVRRVDTVQATQSITGLSGTPSSVTNNYYMFHWEWVNETFTSGATS